MAAAVVVHVATPLTTGAESQPIVWPLSRNRTVPPDGVGVIVAVYVTAAPV